MRPFDESRLDDGELRRRADPSDLLRTLATAGAQVRLAAATVEEAGLTRLTRGERPRAVHIAAVGASETVADLVCMLLTETSPVLVSVGGSGPLPGWVGPLDLVVAVTLSGRAVGPVAQAYEAGRRGAYVLSVGPVGSPLADAADAARGVHVHVSEQSGRHSRSALWSLVVPVIAGLHEAGVVAVDPGVWGAVADRLDSVAEEARPDAEYFVNPAKSLAVDLAGMSPMVLGDGRVTGVAARRAGAMLARTARVPALCGRLPDTAAQVVACLSGPLAKGEDELSSGSDLFADPYVDGPQSLPVGLVLLREERPRPGADPAQAERHNLAQSVHDHAVGRGAKVVELVAEPGPDLVRVAGQIALVDLACVYLAIGYDLDPAQVPGLSDIRLPGRGAQ